MSDTYAELHCHSCYSLQDGASFPEELLDRAAELGMRSLALTDHHGLYGAVRFHRAALERGIAPILGAEVTCEDDSHLVLLAENDEGYKHLCWLLTRAQLEHSKGKARLNRKHLYRHSGGLIALTACRQGRVPRAFLRDEPDEARNALRELMAVFGPHHVYVELEAHLHPDDRRLNALLAELAEAEHVPLVAANNVHYARADGQPIHDLLTALRHHASLDEAEAWLRPNGEYYLKSRTDMEQVLSDYAVALDMTCEIAERCSASLEFRDRALPSLARGDGLRQVPGDQVKEADALLAGLCNTGLDWRYPQGDARREQAARQLDHELAVISETRLSDYFLLVWDIVRYAREQGIMVRGRGSAANSVAAYVLGITAVDPISNDLLFERFLSAESQVMPDIDLDFASDRREEAIQYVYRHYGERYVAMVSNHVTYQPRSAVRDVGRALGMPDTLIDPLAKSLGKWGVGSLEQALGTEPFLDAGVDESHWRLFLRLVEGVLGLPRHLSIHVGGMIITGVPLDELVPLERAAMDNRVVVQWDKDGVEDAGLIKTDILSLRTLGAVTECLQLIQAEHGINIDLDALPLDDPLVYRDLQAADTIGAFQVESRAQQQALIKMQCREFKDLAIEVALIRPGPLQGGMVHPFFRRRQGLETVTFLHPLLEPILRETLGVIVFQEQIMKTAMSMGGFSAGAADMLRRAMSHRHNAGEMSRIRESFIKGALARNVPLAIAEEVFRQIEGFAAYGFCKSHAAAFGRTAYDTLWLRAHYPTEYCCAILNNEPMGFYSPSVVLDDARRHGVGVLGVDINHSVAKCQIEAGMIRLGFSYVRGLGEQGAERIMTSRAGDPFVGLEDVCRRTRLPRRQMEVLIEAGALSTFNADRRSLLWQLGRLRYLSDELPLRLEDDGVSLEAMDVSEELIAEYAATGVLAKGHMMELYRDDISDIHGLTCAAVGDASQGDLVRVAGLVAIRQQPPSAHGMVFVTLEDETGLANLIIYPQVFRQFRSEISQSIVLCVDGRVQRERTHVSVQVTNAQRVK